MKNPFRYGVPVSGEFYFPRPEVVQKLASYASAGQKVLLYGRRRYGKTSLLKEFASALEAKGTRIVSMDIYPITSHRDFLLALATGIKDSKTLGISQRIKGIVGDLFRLHPRIVVEGDDIALDFAIPSLKEDDVKMAIEDTVRLFGKLGEERPVAIIFDEFQKIAEIGDGGWLEGMLRSEIQRQGMIPYVFCGSRRGLILEMFQNPGRPFYQMCTAIELPRLCYDFAAWLADKMVGAGVRIDRATTKALLDKVDWSPNYAQMIAFHLVADPPVGDVSVDDIDRVLDTLCQLNGYMYMTLYDSLSANAQRVVRLVARHQGLSPFRQELMALFGLTSSAVQSAIKSLVNRHVLDDTTIGGTIVFDDPLFLRWIQKRFSF